MNRARVWVGALAMVSTASPTAADTLPAGPAAVATPAPREPAAVPAGEVIVVRGLRTPRASTDEPAAVTVLDRRDLERAPQVLTDELLRAIPSVGTFRRSSSLIADPTSQGLNLRGLGPSGVSRALVLRDGVPANDPFGGWVYWRAISPLGIERVEVTPSGASALFGDYALGGVVQLFSRPIEPQRLQVLLAGGSLGTGRAAVRATAKRGELGVAIDGEGFRSGGYAPIAQGARGAIDGRAESAHGAASVRVEHGRGDSITHATVRLFREDLEAGTRFTTADVRTLTYGVGWHYAPGSGAERADGRLVQVEVFGGTQRFYQSRARVGDERATAALASDQRTPSDNQGALATYTLPIGLVTLVAGADARRIEGTSTDELNPVMLGPDTVTVRAAGGEQRFAGVFTQAAANLGERVELAAALRLDGWQNRNGTRIRTLGNGTAVRDEFDDRTALQLNPRLGVLVHATPVLAVRASGYRAFRAPTLNELYRPFQVGTVLTAANELLAPETLWGAELGPQLRIQRMVVRATGFWNRLDDAVANVTLAEGTGRQRQNLGRTRVRGVELDAAWRISPAWSATLAHVFTDAVVTDAPAQLALEGKRLAQAPRHRATAGASFDDPDLLTAAAELRYLGRQYEDDLNTLPIGAVVLVDVRVSRRLVRGFTAFAAVQNLTDRRYLVGRAGVDTEGAPRTFEVGLAYDTE